VADEPSAQDGDHARDGSPRSSTPQSSKRCIGAGCFVERYCPCRRRFPHLWSSFPDQRYRENARKESAARAAELAIEGDRDSVAVWRRITEAVGQLANKNTARPGDT
jgi:hypothetical protein